MVSDEELDKAFAYAKFGIPYRDVIKLTLLKRASFYHCGHTAIQICEELGLLAFDDSERGVTELTHKGGKYLWEAFSEGSNF